MGAKRFAVAGVAAAAVLVVACGKSREQQAFDQLKGMCVGIVGSTVHQADIQFLSGAIVASPLCCPGGGTLKVPIGTCPGQTTDNPECSLYYEWQAYDPGLCSPTGGCCFICEVRVMKAASTAGQDTPICGARWLPQQPCQLPVCQ